MEFEIVMGLEVHVELSTKTKIFCGCTTEFGGEPNSHTCPVCLGMPGSLPVLNKSVVDRAIKAGLALNCEIQQNNIFDRKNYFYPDLPKDYQISQLYHPICVNGSMKLNIKGEEKIIRIHEIHMEEDAGKLVHDGSGTLIDYNRCGVPLIEIVSEPDFRSTEEVVQYLEKLQEMLVYMDVSDCKMEEGSMRADVNLSVRPMGAAEYGTRTEMKNLNSFKAIQRAITYESERQINLLKSGGSVQQETRRWDDEAGESYAMRSKENAQDYRYFPDPDLIPVSVNQEWISEMKSQMPELPQEKRTRYINDLGITPDTARILTSDKKLAELFEETASLSNRPREAANAITVEVIGLMKEASMDPSQLNMSGKKLADIIEMISEEQINRKVGKELISALFNEDIDPKSYVKEKGLLIVEDMNLIAHVVMEVIADNPQSVADYKSGKQKAFGFLVGKAMAKLKGNGSPRTINGILKEQLDGVVFDEQAIKAAEKAKKDEKQKAQKEEQTSDQDQDDQTGLRAEEVSSVRKAILRAAERNTSAADKKSEGFKLQENKYRTHTCNELTIKEVGRTVRVAGWIHTIRNHGGVAFIDLRDHYGITQVVVKEEHLERLGKESVISVSGKLIERDPETINPNIITGLVEVKAEKIETLGRSRTNLPFEIDSSKETREEVRLAYRYLDLRNPKVHDNIVLRSQIIRFLRGQMEEMGFLEIQTPILANSSPEGARDYLVPSRKHKGCFYALPQAPQQFKQLLMTSGFDKYFQIAPCFRDEDARLDRSPGEFYQLDFEMAFATQEDVFAVAEKVLYETFAAFSDKEMSKPPFVRIPYREAMLKYGTDKPDLRNPLEICDLSDFFVKVDFKPFQGKIVRALRVPEAIKQSKSWFSSMEKFAISIGMKGLGYISVKDDMTYKGPIDKFFTEEQRKEIAELVGLQAGDVLYFISDEEDVVAKYAGQIRTELGKRLNLIDNNRFEFCYITDFPMFEINPDTGGIDFTHNPFSMPQGEMEALETMDPLKINAYQYDIVCNGYELSSGAVRNHRPDIMLKAFEIAGYTEEDVKARFGALYNAFYYGAPPHAGMAPGVDRIVMLLTGEENIREVIAFPLNSNAQDLMFKSPAPVTEQQLRDVHIKIR